MNSIFKLILYLNGTFPKMGFLLQVYLLIPLYNPSKSVTRILKHSVEYDSFNICNTKILDDISPLSVDKWK